MIFTLLYFLMICDYEAEQTIYLIQIRNTALNFIILLSIKNLIFILSFKTKLCFNLLKQISSTKTLLQIDYTKNGNHVCFELFIMILIIQQFA